MGIFKKWEISSWLHSANKYTAIKSQQLRLSILMMKSLTIPFGLMVLVSLACEAPAQSLAEQQFEDQFYGLERIGLPGLHAPEILRPKQQENLVRARDSLMAFLKALRNLEEDATRLTAPPLSNRYKTDLEINKAFFTSESHFISSAVTNFRMPVNQDKITLNLYIVMAVEGSIAIEEACASMVMRIGQWRVAEFVPKTC